MSTPELLAALERYWGYSSFRPLQERIVQSLLGGNDTCVVMPTGRQVALLSIAGAGLGQDRGGYLPADCADAGPGNAASTNGNSRSRVEQRAGHRGAIA